MTEASSGLRARWPRLAVVGAVAGLFSALFGVGGAVVVVPLLMLLLAHDARSATATSLAAIVPTAAWGTAAHGALGNVDWAAALLVGLPAMAGVAAGVALKRRVPVRTLTYAFALVLVAAAVMLLAGG